MHRTEYIEYLSRIASKQCDNMVLSLKNRAARMFTESTYENSSNSLLEELNWHQLSINRKKLKAILMYKTKQEGT